MNHKKNTKPKCLTVLFNPEELDMIDLIKKTRIRNSISDTIRFLVIQEHEKILASRATNGASVEAK